MRRDSRGDDVERDAHRSLQTSGADELPLFGGALAGDEPLPDAKPLSQLSDQDWLAGAQQRVAALTPLSTLQEATALADANIRSLSAMRPRQPTKAAVTKSERAQKRAARGLGAVLRKKAPAGMARDRDNSMSVEAALAIEHRLSAMQQNVLDAFTRYGAMTDETLEKLPAFYDYKYSTARKRRTELVTKGKLASCGKALNGSGSARMTLWDLVERVKPELCGLCGEVAHWQGHKCKTDLTGDV